MYLEKIVEELVEVSFEIEKVKYSNPIRSAGWCEATYLLTFAISSGLSEEEILERVSQRVSQRKEELQKLLAEKGESVAV